MSERGRTEKVLKQTSLFPFPRSNHSPETETCQLPKGPNLNVVEFSMDKQDDVPEELMASLLWTGFIPKPGIRSANCTAWQSNQSTVMR